MRSNVTVAASVRDSRGKNEARRLRRANLIPAVVYGAYREAVPVAVSPKDIRTILKSSSGQNTIFDVAISNGETTPVMLVDLQRDPIKGNLLHIDLKRIDLTKRIRVPIPVTFHGDPRGVKTQGGLFEVVERHVEIECLPDDIPEKFDIDVTPLLIGQAVRASDLPLTGSMKLLSPPDVVLFHVVAQRGAHAAAVTEGETAEPEVIKKGKKEEGEKK